MFFTIILKISNSFIKFYLFYQLFALLYYLFSEFAQDFLIILMTLTDFPISSMTHRFIKFL